MTKVRMQKRTRERRTHDVEDRKARILVEERHDSVESELLNDCH